MLGFAKALGEFGATITFVSNIPGETQVLSIAIYDHVEMLEFLVHNLRHRLGAKGRDLSRL